MNDFHKKNSLKPGMLKEELRANLNIEPRFFSNLITSLKDVVIEKELVRLATFSVALSQVDETLKINIIGLLEKGGFQPPTKEELSQSLKLDMKHLLDILKLMVKEDNLVRINDSMYITSFTYRKWLRTSRVFLAENPK